MRSRIARKRIPVHASFDCTKAKGSAEQEICSDTDLADLDLLLAKTFKQKLSSAGTDKTKLLKQQREWLKERNGCMEDAVPSLGAQCLNDSYVKQIRNLGGTEDLLLLMSGRCRANNWSFCFGLGLLGVELKRWSSLAEDLAKPCTELGGELCLTRVDALLALKREAEAVAVLQETCDRKRGLQNEACARLNLYTHKQKNKSGWSGLYRDGPKSTVLVTEQEKGELSFEGEINDTLSQCEFIFSGILKGDQILVESDPENPDCKPIITKKGATLTIEDPNFVCNQTYCGAHSSVNGTFKLDSSLKF